MSEYITKKQAKWRPILYKEFGDWWMKCTSCGYIAQAQNEKAYKYCPNCGARMNGDEE